MCYRDYQAKIDTCFYQLLKTCNRGHLAKMNLFLFFIIDAINGAKNRS